MREIIKDLGEVHVTESPDELAPLLERTLGSLECFVSDGGDGALHCALNAAWPICVARGLPLPPFLPTNGGTIDFVARKAGIRGDGATLVSRAVARMREGRSLSRIELDSLRLELRGEGDAFTRLGFAVAAGGIGNRFFDDYYASAAPSAGTIVSVISRTLASLALGSLPGMPRGVGARARRMFAPTHARVRIDGEEVPTLRHGGIHAGAFDVDLGGVVRVFPFAREPGALHFQAGAISPAQIVRNLPNVLTGRAIQSSSMRDQRGERLSIEALGDELLKPVVDGEVYTDVREVQISAGPGVPIARP